MNQLFIFVLLISVGCVQIHGSYLRSLSDDSSNSSSNSNSSDCGDDGNLVLCRDLYIEAQQNYTDSLNTLNDKFSSYNSTEEELISANNFATYIYCTPEQIDLGEAMERLSRAMYEHELSKFELMTALEQNIITQQQIIDALNCS